MIQIGAKIREIRIDRNLSQSELAKKIGVQRAAISKYELNAVEPYKQT